MEDQSKTLAVSVRAKEFVSYHCSCCGHCCRHIENCVMVESLDAYRMAKHLRNQHCGISSTDDVLLRYCEPMPLTDEGYPIYVLKTVGADATCIFLRENQCSIYAARPRTCRLYPFSVGPGERGRDFEYCLCFDDNQQHHFNSRKVLLFAWATVYGLIQGVMGYMFLVPYFLIVALIAELCMVGKNTYRSAVRNRIGWMVNSIGNFVGCAVPLWWSWDSYQEMAASSGFDANTLNMQLSMVTSPALMLLGVAITAVLAILGTLFGQRLLRKHFQKAGIVG